MAPKTEVRSRVFVSYSRRDSAFVATLTRDLSTHGILPDFDQSTYDPSNIDTGISAEDEWWTRLQELIAAAEVVVFVVSPASASSKVCEEEIAFAQALGKRVICILHRPIDLSKAPPRLSALNIKINFAEGGRSSYADALSQLVSALRRDVKWLRKASLVTSAALRWKAADQPLDLLLRGTELIHAEDWASRRPTGVPEHSAIFLGTSSALDGYAGKFRFPCCDAKVMDVDHDEQDPPSQFHVSGCQDVPKAIRYDEQEPLRAFRSRLVEDYLRLRQMDAR